MFSGRRIGLDNSLSSRACSHLIEEGLAVAERIAERERVTFILAIWTDSATVVQSQLKTSHPKPHSTLASSRVNTRNMSKSVRATPTASWAPLLPPSSAGP